jgi:hypothetical protein
MPHSPSLTYAESRYFALALIEIAHRFRDGEHDRVVGPHATVDELKTRFGFVRLEVGWRGAGCERDVDCGLFVVGLQASMVRRFENMDWAWDSRQSKSRTSTSKRRSKYSPQACSETQSTGSASSTPLRG